ncbi:MAG: hypothetical protein P8M19_01325 [Crocinitomicaceae bacterium]|nr:hypothetical protein [Crocinitomicaceae bacterium]MDG1658111.1 hypothetical protein [Crocinitomicaceae bacterium]MDG2440285.1 hypothetical protein [Crocinitomicaceae bacterium]|tara:strand:+ start:4147 stop:4278 length:132 start_codon:yes stop_codon:yes gene_type:complete
MFLGVVIGLPVALAMMGIKSYKQKQMEKQDSNKTDILDQGVDK